MPIKVKTSGGAVDLTLPTSEIVISQEQVTGLTAALANISPEGVANIEVDGDTTYIGQATHSDPVEGDLRFSKIAGLTTPYEGAAARTNRIEVRISDHNLSFTPNGSWGDVDSTNFTYARRSDVVIPNVSAGQWIEYGFNAYVVSANPAIHLDAWTVVDGVAVNKFHAVESPSFWTMYQGVAGPIGGSAQYKLKAEDIENGSVRIRLRQKGNSQSERTIMGANSFMAIFWGDGPFGARQTPQLIFDGQSFNFAPVTDPSYPIQLLESLNGQAFGSIVGQGGTTYSERNDDVATRVDTLIRNSDLTVIMDIGGVSDLYPTPDGAGMSASATLNAAESYASARKAAGADYVVGFTVTPATDFTGSSETNRVSYNNMLRNSSVYDAIVDQAAISELSDPTDTDYFYDGLHPTELGASLIAAEALQALQSLGVV